MLPRLSRRSATKGLLLGVPSALLVGCGREPQAESLRSPVREREIVKRIDAERSVDGAGVSLRRSLGSRTLSELDPFLLLDEIHSNDPEDFVAGFPTHPHRGFETVSYVLEGAIEHRDSLGNQGRLGPGSVQWMTAGHGIVHSEMPKGERFWGFQLWVNLPAAKKMMPPRYQNLEPERVVEVAVMDASARVVAGNVGAAHGPVEGIAVAPQMIDLTLPGPGRTEHAVPATHNAFLYVISGSIEVGHNRTALGEGQLGVLGPGDSVSVITRTSGRALLLAGQPIGEPVVRHGPFVMNTADEIRQAVEDYRTGRLVQL